MWQAPGFSSWATLNAFRTTSGMTSPVSIWVFHFVKGRNASTMSTYWWDSLWRRPRASWPVIATTGARSRLASARPVVRFVAPGPRVARHTPARPVSRPQTSAMKAAACSWRTATKRTGESRRASFRSSVSSPGTPKT